MAIITAPTIIVAIDKSIDVSVLYCCTDEDEKENEKTKVFELIFSNCKNETELVVKLDNLSSLRYPFKHYPKPYLNLIFPPPEFV